MTQVNLGNALQALGEHESGTARLEEAVAAYRAALEEWTRERVPLDWAMTQNNLGTALWRLGERESGTAERGQGEIELRSGLRSHAHEPPAAPQKADAAGGGRGICNGPMNETALAVERCAQACAGVER
jgi:Tetratricopeptide repeat